MEDRLQQQAAVAELGRQALQDETTQPLLERAAALTGTHLDIDERKRAEEALAQAQQRQANAELHKLRQAVEQSPVGVVMTDPQGNIEYVNPRFSEMSGYSAQEALGQTPRLVNSGFHPPEFYREMWGTILGGQVFTCEMRNRRKNGEIYWEQALIAPVRNELGEIVLFTSFQEEITGRKRMEQELAQSEEKFREIFEAMQDGYMTADLNGTLRLVNPAAVRLLGYPDQAALLAVPIADIFVDQQERAQLREASLRDGLAHHRGQFRRQDGSLRTFEGSTWTRPGPDGQPRSIESMFRDVTERVQADDERQARQAADEANRLKSQFLAHMSHEIRTPLHAILGMAHLALNTPLSERQQHYLQSIQRGGQALLAIVNDILDLSKVEAGKLDLERIEFHLDDVIEDLVGVLARKAEAKGLEFLVRVAPEVPGHLRGDPMRLVQVLVNLVGNAVKFTRRGQVILAISLDPGPFDPVQLRFEVSDTGVGLTEKQISGLFTSFAQADSSITREYGGTGLGLSICARLVHLMQGEIGARSVPGQGSTFSFTAVFETTEPRGGSRCPDLSDLRALVIEDDASSRDLLASALRRLALQVTGKSTAEDALAEVERAELPYDLIFIDFHLPGRLNCLESARRLREAAPPRTRIVIVANHGEEVAERAAEAGVNSVLFKPFTASNLLDTLLSLTGRPEFRRWRAEPAAKALPAEVLQAIQGARVLVVEDNLVNQEIARELLQSAGLQVDVVSDGRQAVERLLASDESACPWQAVLMDLQMPEMDGYTASAAIRKEKRFSNLPILAMTAHVLPEERRRCYAAGMDDYISKPIDPSALFATLRRWICLPATAPATGGEFPAIAGVDTPNGLARVAGNGDLYRSLLLELARQGESTCAALRAAQASDDREQLATLAHKLRGVAGNLGVMQVAALATNLERLARAGEPSVACLAELLEKQAEADDLILAALAGWRPAPPAALEPVDSGPPEAARARLVDLLETSDAGAGAALQQLRPLIGPGVSLERLQGLVDRFEFAEALGELRSLSLGRP